MRGRKVGRSAGWHIVLFGMALAWMLTGGTGRPLQAAETLAQLLEETGTSWIVGKWQGPGEPGATASSEFAWELDQRMLAVRFASGETRAQAMITFHPHDALPVHHHSADNRGGTGHGHWQLRDGKATLVYEHVRASGERVTIALEHERIGDDQMRIQVHNVDAAGAIQPDVLYEMVLRR